MERIGKSCSPSRWRLCARRRRAARTADGASRVVRRIVCPPVLFLSASLLTGCDFSGIFASIQSEVPLKIPSIRGVVTGLVKCNNKLYACAGQLWEKDASKSEGKWTAVNFLPGKKITSIVSKGACVYACVSGEGVYTYTSNGAGRTGGTTTPSTVLGKTNGAIRIGGSDNPFLQMPCELSSGSSGGGGGGSGSSSDGGIKNGSDENVLGSGTGYVVTTKAVYTKSNSSGTSCTYTKDGTFTATTSPILGCTSDGKGCFYVLDGTDVHCRTVQASGGGNGAHCAVASGSATSCKVAHTVTNPLCIAHVKNGNTEFLLIGGSQGYKEIKLETGSGSGTGCLKAENVRGPEQWGEDSVTPKDRVSQYEGTIGRFAISDIYTVESTSGAGGTNGGTNKPDVYVVVGDSQDGYTGLWRFDAQKKEWNRE
ncbi:hypothetical protein KD991_02295 [Treponema pallidum]|uniref:hypothetical protein n=2 Tax=Treponema pallidum TaxID=160 RepID=UPI0001CC71DD|nr:hypothetical protein [Treponema pallidum]ADD72583.1 conserved hypothetical protein [Treponema pallidum subsp. pallidum str. Chicago]AEZ60788.1 hypothetical protein TPADAL_0462 [Treponema pallidum subsp. pallidum DAL-1]ANI43389.1 hypothetical protein SD24_02270 [Treponema pallidum subsp. pallidum]ANI44349.1 hypothetical protein SD25_02260 [Treponema pallidum subsp. pallidum]ANI45314.1 hypothetical protein SD22_02250 [Treponema pallidum subsp. pallidum]